MVLWNTQWSGQFTLQLIKLLMASSYWLLMKIIAALISHDELVHVQKLHAEHEPFAIIKSSCFYHLANILINIILQQVFSSSDE